MSRIDCSPGKSSRAEWIGVLPAGWREVRLKIGLQLITEKAWGDTPKVGLENIESWTGRYVETTTEFEGDGTAFQSGDVLFGKLRPYLAKAMLAEVPGQAVGDFHVLRPTAEVNGSFALYYLLSRDFISVVDGSTYGAKMPRASWEFMSNLPLPLPPLPEQTAIAAFLDRETRKIDALVEEQWRLIELLKEKRQAVISHAVTKGLNPNVKMKPSGVEWLGEVPEHWDVCPLVRVADRVVVGIAEAATHAYLEVGVPILRSTNIRAGSIEGEVLHVDPAYALDRGSKLIRAGDLITVRTGHAGVTAVVPEHLDQCQCFTMLITTLTSTMVPNFFCYWLNSVGAKFYFGIEAWGSAQPNISVPILKETRSPVPPTEEQYEITRFLDRELSRLDVLMIDAEAAIGLLRERRAALISAAVTGKIDARKATVGTEAA